ncbi:PREDICTED: mitochondrial import inner membrane translocase subunit TIM50-C-like [Dufourea novaeangliae]|uniref:Mitochondrial import inner membrane translocase subunit TIM50 n=1 Tax=Dufourea novaeangliae TaxID=178035 RepID=A0A154PG67_DUFNO|nr:PREDICTED: mitochondrial import inner membrane translocase subunit TIM50-C-like [Dufourea novaeangliae]KZC10849.1 Mitochondrial import inner membrane translocase subunit TIM50-C [Dufourea novaeangliae]
MAFATRSLRHFYKIYNGSTGTVFSTLRQSLTRISVCQNVQLYNYNTEIHRPKITGSLTNIQSTVQSLSPDALDNKRIEEAEKEDAEEKERREHSNRMLKYSFTFFGVFITFGLSYIIYDLTKTRYDEQGNIIEDEYSNLPLYEKVYRRLKREFNYYTKMVQEPSRDKLLPDPLKYPYIQPPYTLVLELTDVLVHPDWTYETGWRFKKRPGVDQFLEAVAPPQFEIVVYTAEQGLTVFPILDILDPNGYIMYRLVRDTTRFVDGHHVKDLDALNRDLSKVIVVDWNSKSTKFHPENTLRIPQWSGNNDDTTLYDLAAFLKTILATNVQDVRDVLNYYKQFDDPLQVFRENQRKLLMQMEEEETRAQQESSKVLTSKWKPSFLRNR